MDTKKLDFVKRMGKKKLKLTKRKNFGLGGLLGLEGGAGGTGFSTESGTNAAQLSTAYNQSQDALKQQNNLTGVLTPQAAQAVQAQNVLSGQFANQAAGLGPNVATNQLNQATGANVANQAALMGGQRGAGANVGLMARQVAQQGANTQQQAAGQAATTQAQQQIAAENAQAGLASNQIGQAQGAVTQNTNATQGEQGVLQGANTANNANQASMANTRMGQQPGAIGSVLGAAGSALAPVSKMLGFAEGGEVEHGPHKLDFVHKMAKMGLEHYGKPTENFKSGGNVQASPDPSPAPAHSHFGAPQASAEVIPANVDQTKMQSVMDGFRQTKADGGPILPGAQAAQDSMRSAFKGHYEEGGSIQDHFSNYFMASEGGDVPAKVSPGEVYLTPEQVEKVVNEDIDPSKIGKKFKGKAAVKGDSVKNDTIDATLQSGGVVIDRENMGSSEKRKLFVHKSIAKKRASK